MWRDLAGRRGAAVALLLLVALAALAYAQGTARRTGFYSRTRDMRRSPAIPPQEMLLDLPDSSVAVTGQEPVLPLEVAAATLKNPVAPDTSSLRKGGQTYALYCTPCHGPNLDGKGPVAPKFLPPPDLLAKMTRDRADGYIYRYLRHGGAVMPKYGFALSQRQVWDVINYLRDMQRKTPR